MRPLRTACAFLATCVLAWPGSVALAYPQLQLYIEGSVYSPETETWTISSPTFKLWVIGDVKREALYDVNLTSSFFGSGGALTMVPITTTLLTDPSVPEAVAPGLSGTGDHPVLPRHGNFDDPSLDHWQDYGLGNFTRDDSPIGDFITSFPLSFNSTGQINAYDVTITGWDRVHFDAYGCGEGSPTTCAKYVKAPFSHDAAGGSHPVPEPASLLLLGSGLVGLAAWRNRFCRKPGP